MKSLLIFLFLIPLLGFSAQKVTPKSSEFSLENLRLTLIHTQKLVGEQQAALDEAKVETGLLRENLNISHEALISSQGKTDALQIEINKVTDDRNNQATLKDQALNKVEELKIDISKKNIEIKELHGDIRKLKTIICSQAAAVAFLLLMWLGAVKWFPPYSLGLVFIVPAGAFWFLWFLL